MRAKQVIPTEVMFYVPGLEHITNEEGEAFILTPTGIKLVDELILATDTGEVYTMSIIDYNMIYRSLITNGKLPKIEKGKPIQLPLQER